MLALGWVGVGDWVAALVTIGRGELVRCPCGSTQRKPAGGGGAEAVRRAQSMVLVLNNDNARHAVEDNAELLLLGYAPWCERSAQLMPRFAEAAAALRAMGSSVAFAKLDGERYPKAAASVGAGMETQAGRPGADGGRETELSEANKKFGSGCLGGPLDLDPTVKTY